MSLEGPELRRIPVLAGALVAVVLITASVLAPGAQAAVGDFHPLAASPVPVTSVTVDPTSIIIYAQEDRGTRFFRYDPRTDAWTELTAAPIDSGNNGGGAYLNGKIYTAYTNNGGQLGVYDIASDSWTTITNPLGNGTGDITAVGDSLYLVEAQKFVRYNPATATTTNLADAPAFPNPSNPSSCDNLGFEPWGGLQPLEGKIYGHQGDGCKGFAVYDIASNAWLQLPDVPDDVTGTEGTEDAAVLGSAIDPASRTYFTYGGYDENHFFRYDIATSKWSTVDFPLNSISDGGMAYVSLPGLRGVYAVFGESDPGFTRYETAPAEADLSLTKAADAAKITAGRQITYTLAVKNAGPTGAQNVTVSDPLPSNVSLVSASASQGSCSGSSTVSCNVGTLLTGGSATVTIKVNARDTGTAKNTATAFSLDRVDPNPANNSASATTAVVSGHLKITHASTKVNKHGTLVRLRCKGLPGTRCKGTLALEATSHDSRLGSARAKAADVAFDLVAGTPKGIRVQIPTKTRDRLGKRHKAVVRAIAHLADGTTVKRLITIYGH